MASVEPLAVEETQGVASADLLLVEAAEETGRLLAAEGERNTQGTSGIADWALNDERKLYRLRHG